MKSLFLFFVITSFVFTSTAQTIEGIYANKWESTTGEAVAYDLVLKSDGTFIFETTRTYLSSTPEKTLKAQGTWELNGHLLILNTNEQSNTLASDLNMNKARYVSISERNPNFNLVKPSLKFYRSDVFYSKDMELFKTESSVTSSD